MNTMKCNLCQSLLHLKIYDSGDALSLTSLCTTHPSKTEVYVCSTCTHVQSSAISKIEEFYDRDYNILVESEEEDQVYEVQNDKPIYRTDHQVHVMLEQLEIKPNTKILDYGCAKSGTMRILSTKRSDVDIYLFDISEQYLRFWKKFVTPQKCATYNIPLDWKESFDIVTSFFSLEHIDRPSESLSNIHHLLRDDGILYGIVPNYEANSADLIVLDHVNHFTKESLSFLLCKTGFDVISISDSAHKGTFVFKARKSKKKVEESQLPKNIVRCRIDLASKLGCFWQNAGNRLQDFEKDLGSDSIVALYGAGFYGTFITSWLKNRDLIRYVIDRNTFLHGRTIHGAPVITPEEVPSDVNTIIVGLNPNHAEKIIQGVTSFKDREFKYFYL